MDTVPLEKEVFSQPPFFKGENGLETIVVLGTNDIHGTLFPLESKTVEEQSQKKIPYTKAGLTVFASYLKILQNQFQDHLLWLDGGDEFQGALESNSFQGASMVSFFNDLGLTAAAIGNHEFDFGLDVLEQRMKEARYLYISSNIVDKKTGLLPQTFSHTEPQHLFSVGKLKVGVVGLTTRDTPTASKPGVVDGFTFIPAQESILQSARLLRAQGAHLVILVAHAGLKCKTPEDKRQLLIRSEQDLQGNCQSDQEIVELLHALPVGTLDAVVAGHTHEIVHHFVLQGQGQMARPIPVIEGGVRGAHTNLVYLTYDFTQKRLRNDLTRIEGPIPICEKVFANQRNCDGSQIVSERGPLVTPTFHGQPIVIQSDIRTKMKTLEEQIAEKKRQVIGHAARLISHTRKAESEQGNLVADALRVKTKADVALINGGAIRSPWEAGVITYGDLFRSIPFDNAVVVAHVSGEQLKRILRAAQSGKYELFSVSGLVMRLISLELPAKGEDMNADGQIEPWEINRVIDVTLSDGQPILDKKQYTLATVDFLVAGGDGMGPVFSEVSKKNIQVDGFGFLRDVVKEYVQTISAEKGSVNQVEVPLIDPYHPRLILSSPLLSKKQ